MSNLTTVIVDRSTAQQVVFEVVEVLEDPATRVPPSFAELMAAEMNGYTWNFETGEFEPENA